MKNAIGALMGEYVEYADLCSVYILAIVLLLIH